MKEHIGTFLTDFWWLVVTPVIIWFGQLLVRWIFGRVIKSYESEIASLNKSVENMSAKQVELETRMKMFEKEYPDKDYVNGVERRIMAKHDEMEAQAADAHNQQREDFKHIVNRVDETKEQMTELYKLLIEKLH